jgi:TonB family protein
MDRLQKKCVIASAGFHLSLVFILIVGPAFLSSKHKSDDMPTLDFVPSKLVDDVFSGGGNPKASPPPPTPPAPAPAAAPVTPPPPAQRVREPEPTKEVVKIDKPDPDSLEPVKESRKPHKVNIELTPVTHRRTINTIAKQSSDTESREQQLADDRRQRAAAAIRSTARSLRDDVSPTTSIDTNYGPGGGGEAYANYGQIVKSIYENAWIPPDDATSEDPITKVTVTIASDGTVISARIVKPSGDTSADSSVQRTLNRVTFIAKFPDGAKEKQRTYTINFNLKAKRLLG